ncbi:hypothetical protein [Litoribrevibacter albus]|uniref:Uncharacterized protein n=1 Tax=Litoribrevibacter albus TaxID=1473156 RepID=A0AA37SFF2_9GAMM|nr:hypothetical protein [Litoribrevibacter albus]GLQ33542.1 hypothetical protein GCM10007876_40220 [Litoribrevibacter albus]
MIRKTLGWIGAIVLGVAGVYHFLSFNPSASYRDSFVSSDVQVPALAVERIPSQQLLLPEISEQTPLAEFMDEGMRHQFKKVAQQYALDVQFPAYSKPLKMTDWAQLNPLPFVPQKISLDTAEDVSAEIILPHFQITRDDGLTVQVRVYGESANISSAKMSSLTVSSVKVALAHTHSPNNVQLQSELRRGESVEEGVLYEGVISSTKLASLDDGEILVRALVNLEQSGTSELVATFALSDSVAELTEVGDAYIDGADLVIPLSFDVEEAGLYRIRANLFDQASGDPISHLNSSFKLSSLRNEGTLKVHAATLRQSGSAGPYWLSDFSVIKAPEAAGESSAYGRASAEQYPVSGFDLDSYSREEYQNSLNKKRLEFLQKMSSQPL